VAYTTEGAGWASAIPCCGMNKRGHCTLLIASGRNFSFFKLAGPINCSPNSVQEEEKRGTKGDRLDWCRNELGCSRLATELHDRLDSPVSRSHARRKRTIMPREMVPDPVFFLLPLRTLYAAALTLTVVLGGLATFSW
jgi:hypothetical protein